MKIPLRTPDVIRRMTNRFDRIAPEWAHTKRLTALAAMFGYDGWEHLVASCHAQVPHFVFDQDLSSDEERQQRWLAMAQQVAEILDFPLPVALNLVGRIHPTSRLGEPLPLWYDPNPVFDQALMKERDSWWVGMSEVGNPLAPLGFVLAKAYQVSDHARWRSQKQNGLAKPDAISSIWVVVPLNYQKAIAHPHTYFRRGEFVEIAPIPLGDGLREPKKHAGYLASFFSREYPAATEADRTIMLAGWRDDLKTLHLAAGLPANSKRRWVQMTQRVRQELGRSWHWPLDFRPGQADAIETARQQALMIDTELRQDFGEYLRVVRVEG